MKRMQTKRIIDIVMLIVLTALLFTACMLFLPTKTVEAAGSDTTVTLASDQTEIIPGKTLVIKMTVTSTKSGIGWSSLAIRIYPVTKDSDTTIAGMTIASDVAKYLTYDRANDPVRFVGENASLFQSKYNMPISDLLATQSYIQVNLSTKASADLVSADTPIEFEVPLVVSEALADDETIDTLSFSVRPTTASTVTYGIAPNTVKVTALDGGININIVKVGVKIPSTDATLSELKMGLGDDLTAVDLTQSTLSYTVTGKNLADFTILPTANDGATIKVGLTVPATTEAASGEKTKLALSKTTTAVYIDTLAEDGVTTKRYTVGIKIAYVALSSLTVTGSPSPAGVTKNGLAKELEDGTLEYEVNVPESATTAKLSATIDPDFLIDSTDGNKSIGMKGTGGCTVSLTYQSGGNPITIYNIKDKCEVTMTLTAPDKTTKVVYKLVFNKLSEDNEVESIKVKGADSNKEYENDESKATDESVDYFFVLDSETSDPAKGKIVLTLPTGATATVDGEEYDADKEYELGSLTVVVTAAAGNTKSYTVKLSATLVLEFVDGSPFKFIFEKEEMVYGEPYYFRRSYAEESLVHGKDDKEFERLVIGGVAPGTPVSDFMTNFPENQKASIKLYRNDGTLIIDRGNPATGISSSALSDPELYSVGTGWYIEYGKGETPSETVYVSVLGDVDGDGFAYGDDSVAINSYLDGYLEWTVEVRLAAYIINSGYVDPADSVNILAYLDGTFDLSLYL